MKDFLIPISDATNLNKTSQIFNQNIALIYKINRDLLVKSTTFMYYDNLIMGISDDDFSITNNMADILKDIIFEYEKNYFKGIFLDFQNGDHSAFVEKLALICQKKEIPLYVPVAYAECAENAIKVFDMAISGGNIYDILEYALLKYGSNKLLVKITHTTKEFSIPSEDENGHNIVLDINTVNNSVFFSENLCTNYFTRMENEEKCIFTIFDDKESFSKKIEIVKKLNIKSVFISTLDMKKFEII